MKPLHYIVIAAALALTGLLYFGGNTVAPKKEKSAGPMAEGGTPGERQAAGLNIPTPANFDSLLVAAKRKLSPAAQADIVRQENAVTRGDVKEQQILAYEALGKLWQQYKNRAIAAHYFGKSGKLENSQKKLNFAAHLFSEELHEERDPHVRQWMAEEAIACYQQSIGLNPDNDTTRIDLAEIYIAGTGETMKGIEQLLTIVRKDSTNIPANLILGRMAVESGQLDKAIQRGQTILGVDKENVEAYWFMAEAYRRKGDVAKAKELLTEAKRIVSNPAFSKEVDEYMKTF
ncbi:tetratricopeptide repeat protein [Taibaiella helva]|uniref:tetratricopeptide repeat protein n=1 Tax=Taibaiella helva TaxID=2301235 RepID=UPI000E574764|nr:tetratricopeptide repeat protein [Taibaiella helva]